MIRNLFSKFSIIALVGHSFSTEFDTGNSRLLIESKEKGFAIPFHSTKTTMSLSSEPLGTYLMPIYAGASWIGILTIKEPLTTLLPVSIFGALWALRNTVVGGQFDLGVVTMGLVAITIATDVGFGGIRGAKYALLVESLFVALNYILPFLIWEQLEKSLAKSKSMLWFKVFKVYLSVKAAFWVYAAYKIYTREQGKRYD